VLCWLIFGRAEARPFQSKSSKQVFKANLQGKSSKQIFKAIIKATIQSESTRQRYKAKFQGEPTRQSLKANLQGDANLPGQSNWPTALRTHGIRFDTLDGVLTTGKKP